MTVRANGQVKSVDNLGLLHDRQAAEGVVGACLLPYGDAVPTVLARLVPGDLADFPNLDAALGAIAALHEAGSAIEALSVADQLRRDGAAWESMVMDLVGWQANAPAPSSVGTLCDQLLRLKAKRDQLGVGLWLQGAAVDLTTEPDEVADEAKGRLAQLSAGMPTAPGDLTDEELFGEPEEARNVVVPGAIGADGRQRPPLLCQDDRAMFVGPEGAGKSEFSRQLLTCAAWGLQPLNPHQAIEPVPSLLVDLENPRTAVRNRLGRLRELASRHSGYRAPLTLWLQPGGIDLRKRADRLAFEDVLRRRRPRLVFLGPIYKAYTRKSSESDEQVAAEVQAVLDDLRTRYSFALVLEHHAGHGESGAREMRPFGSSLWLRWPEYGIALVAAYRDQAGNLRPVRTGRVKHVPDVLLFDRWRGDRNIGSWPARVDRGDVWPWLGYYEERF